MEHGTIIRMIRDRGFGYLRTDRGEDLFFHRSAVDGADAFERLTEGQAVEFLRVWERQRQRSHAAQVRRVDTGATTHPSEPSTRSPKPARPNLKPDLA